MSPFFVWCCGKINGKSASFDIWCPISVEAFAQVRDEIDISSPKITKPGVEAWQRGRRGPSFVVFRRCPDAPAVDLAMTGPPPLTGHPLFQPPKVDQDGITAPAPTTRTGAQCHVGKCNEHYDSMQVSNVKADNRSRPRSVLESACWMRSMAIPWSITPKPHKRPAEEANHSRLSSAIPVEQGVDGLPPAPGSFPPRPHPWTLAGGQVWSHSPSGCSWFGLRIWPHIP